MPRSNAHSVQMEAIVLEENLHQGDCVHPATIAPLVPGLPRSFRVQIAPTTFTMASLKTVNAKFALRDIFVSLEQFDLFHVQ